MDNSTWLIICCVGIFEGVIANLKALAMTFLVLFSERLVLLCITVSGLIFYDCYRALLTMGTWRSQLDKLKVV